MRKITIQPFLLLFVFLCGWQLQAKKVIGQGDFDNNLQNKLVKAKTKSKVLNDLTTLLYDTQDVNEQKDENVVLEDLACDEPVFSTYKDCNIEGLTIMVTIEVEDLGSASTVVVFDDAGTAPQELSNPGVVTFGPYPYDTDVTISVADADDSSCEATEVVNSDSCPPIPCQMADPFCSDEGLFFENNHENGPGQTPDDMPDLDYGCLFSQPNPSWYFMQIGEPGDATLHIVQNTEFDEDGNPIGTPLDVDFIAWGPFSSMEEACSNLTVENQVADNYMGDGCSYSAAPEEDFGIVGAETGDIYVLLITNYNGSAGYIQVQQTDGDASTDCSIVTENQILACPNEEIELEPDEESEIDAYLWYYFDEQEDDYVLLEDESGDSMIVTEGGKYKVEVFDGMGDTSSEIFMVVYSPEPEINELEELVSLCGVSQATLDGTVSNPEDYGGVQYRWKDENDDVIGSSATLDVTTPGIYTLEITTVTLNSEGYETDEECVTVIEVEVTDADFVVDLGGDQILCEVESVVLEADIEGEGAENADFTWYDENGEIIGNDETLEVFETGNYTVEVDAGGCIGTDTVYIELNDAPDFDLGGDITTCSLEELVIEAFLLEGEITDSMVFEWSYNGESIDEDESYVYPADYGYGTYTLTIYEGDPECANTHEITVSEVEDFGVELSADNDLDVQLKYCEDDPEISDYEITFTAETIGLDAEEVEFVWYLNGDVIEGENESSYTALYDIEGEYEDEYTVEIVVGTCSAEASLIANVEYGPYDHPCKISEGISPGNNDGLNDYLDLTFLNDRSGIEKFTVYNRYGTKVYDQANYTNEWRGQDNSGNELVSGTYYYVLEMKNEDPVFGKTKKGWVYVNQSIN